MERNRFSFRRKGSGKERKAEKAELEGSSGFDYDTLSYVSQKEAKEIDEELINEYSLTEDQWIELIGLGCATAIAKIYPVSGLTKGKGSVLVCCGPDRNGAEGLVCARHLKTFGYRPTVFYPKLPTTVSVTTASKVLYSSRASQCEKIDIPFLLYLPSEAHLLTDSYNLIVDAVFGGQNDPSTAGDYMSVIQTMIKCKIPVISITTPSGWEVNNDAPEPEEEEFLQPEMIISTIVPLFCSKHFKGKHHVLTGRFLPPDLSKKFGLFLPSYSSTDLWQELHKSTSSKTSNNEAADGNGKNSDHQKDNKEEKSSD